MAATGQVASVDPEAFLIVDGKLYLNWNEDVRNTFAKKGDEAITEADKNWAKLNKEN